MTIAMAIYGGLWLVALAIASKDATLVSWIAVLQAVCFAFVYWWRS